MNFQYRFKCLLSLLLLWTGVCMSLAILIKGTLFFMHVLNLGGHYAIQNL